MNSAVVLLTCLLFVSVQGQPAGRSNKCRCSNGFLTRITRNMITAEPVVHYPSNFCPRTEIIITIKKDVKKCVDPQSALGQRILTKMNGPRRTAAVHGMTTSSQTSISSSATQHTTSKH